MSSKRAAAASNTMAGFTVVELSIGISYQAPEEGEVIVQIN